MAKDTILKELKAICWHAFKDNKWHVALQVIEFQAKYMGLFEGQCLSSLTEQELGDCKGALKDVGVKLEHPPPLARM